MTVPPARPWLLLLLLLAWVSLASCGGTAAGGPDAPPQEIGGSGLRPASGLVGADELSLLDRRMAEIWDPSRRWAPLQAALLLALAWLAALRLLRPRHSRGARRAFSLAALLFLVLFFGVLEKVCDASLGSLERLREDVSLEMEMAAPDRLRIWRCRPNWTFPGHPERIAINSQGLRETGEVPGQRPADEFRIVCLGDSWTFGLGVRQDDAWVRVLERGLARRCPGIRIRVVNAGIFGYCSYQGLQTLNGQALGLSPSLLVIPNFHNRDTLALFERGGLGLPKTGSFLALQRRLSSSQVYLWLRWQFMAAAVTETLRPGDQESETPAQPSEGWVDAVNRAMVERAREADVPVAFLDLHDEDIYEFYGGGTPVGEVVRDTPLSRLGRSAGVPVMQMPFMERSWLLRDDPRHPNPEGHRRIAEALEEFLVREELLPCPAASPPAQ